ncbi:MAG: four helix bundle protein [Candidatus Peribacteraceae bacterium]|jgi:four helix bundle protein|nr:four helix bundle protein [Candidatus Peribacteraceae bacterium]HCI03672.1 four helix bundle protein [Candidatus Peribacteria bacterium]|tara:strand:- start:2463 stop:2837 length:375 start_codon:yes stop_codon:yes gene_type:complete
MKKYLQLNDLSAYKIAYKLSEEVWDVVKEWDRFAKNTIGEQFVRSVDSIAANIAEGFGRRTKRDKIKFYNYSFSSTYESLNWNEKAKRRELISQVQYDSIFAGLKKLPREINNLSNFTMRKLDK